LRLSVPTSGILGRIFRDTVEVLILELAYCRSAPCLPTRVLSLRITMLVACARHCLPWRKRAMADRRGDRRPTMWHISTWGDFATGRAIVWRSARFRLDEESVSERPARAMQRFAGLCADLQGPPGRPRLKKKNVRFMLQRERCGQSGLGGRSLFRRGDVKYLRSKPAAAALYSTGWNSDVVEASSCLHP
jgi:hypothetical protein